MSQSIRSQAVAAVIAALSGGGSPATGGVFRSRTEQFENSQTPAYNVWPVEERLTQDDTDNAALKVTLRLRVQCLVAAQQEVDVVADPLAVYAHQVVMADESLGQLVQDARLVETKWSIVTGDTDVCSLDLDFEVEYQIFRADPTVNAFYYAVPGAVVAVPTSIVLADEDGHLWALTYIAGTETRTPVNSGTPSVVCLIDQRTGQPYTLTVNAAEGGTLDIDAAANGTPGVASVQVADSVITGKVWTISVSESTRRII